jgi:short-subunit dehydrogenase
MTTSVIITGASQGLGVALAQQLVEAGQAVVGVHRGNSPSPQWLDLLSGGRAAEVIGTVASDQVVEQAFQKADSLGDLRTVINCAGVGVFGAAGGFRREDVDTVFEANLVGTILFSERAFARFKSSSGLIVNVMSTAAHVGRVNEVLYCASKWGARGYTEALRAEAKGTGVRVVGVYPGGMKTSFWAGTSTDPSKFMSAADVAEVVVGAMTDRQNLYVSDLVINRG